MQLRKRIEEFIALDTWMRNHSEGLSLLREVGTVDETKIKRIAHDTSYHASFLEHELRESLLHIRDEEFVHEDIVVSKFIETPSEIVDLYREQADIKGQQSSLHSELEGMGSDEERRLAAIKLLDWQLEVDCIWDDIKSWKNNLRLPSERIQEDRSKLDVKNLRSLISKTQRKIRERPGHELVGEWKRKVEQLRSELKSRLNE